jgi:hypothetical protein
MVMMWRVWRNGFKIEVEGNEDGTQPTTREQWLALVSASNFFYSLLLDSIS